MNWVYIFFQIIALVSCLLNHHWSLDKRKSWAERSYYMGRTVFFFMLLICLLEAKR